MAEARSNVEAVREAFRRRHDTSGGSVDHWMSLMADRIDFRSLADGEGGLDFTGAKETRDEVRGCFEGLLSNFEMNRCRIDRLIAEGGDVVAPGATSRTDWETGKRFKTPIAAAFRFEDGRIVAYFEYHDTARISAALQPG